MKNSLAFLTVCIAIVFCTEAGAVSTGTYRYVYQVMGKKEGEQVTKVKPGGVIVVDYAFNDRGRGPELHEEIRLDQNGLPYDYRVTGHSYLGGEVDESFERDRGQTSWRTTSEKGEQQISEPHVYLNADGTPESLAVIARALLRDPDRSMPALPAGEVRLTELRQVTLDGGTVVTLYAIDGLGLTPEYVWLDADGVLFGVIFGWSSLVAEGSEGQADRLQHEQEQADGERLAELAERYSHRYDGPVAIRDVNLFDSATGRVLPGATVVVFRDRIGAVYTEQVELGDDVRIVDGRGKTVLPALWDMHEHAGPWRSYLQVAGGVTSVRDLANNNDKLLDLVRRIDAGTAIGPRVYRSGFIDQKGPYSGPGGKIVSSLDEAISAVEWYAQRGYQQIKLYSSIDPAWVAPIARAAHGRGMRLSGHIPSFMTAEQAVLDGYDEIQHINMIFLNFVAGPEDDTRTPIRFTAVAERAGDLDLDSREVEDFIRLLKERGTIVDPTVAIFEDMFLNRPGEMSPPFAMVADHLPASLRRQFMGSTMEVAADQEETYRRSFDALLAMIGTLHRAGVQLVAGTDALAGFTLHREMELYVKAGLTPSEVLTMVTLDAARIVKADQMLGSLTPGKNADLILVDGNPVDNISDIRNISLVMKDGIVFYPSELYQAVGIQPFTAAPSLETVAADLR